jgi:hypothetical protein
MVVRLSDIRAKTGKKCIFCVFRLFLPLCQTALQPYMLSYINGLRINQPKDQSVKFSRKNLENWRFWKTAILKNRPFWIFFLQKKNFFCFILMKISPISYGRLDGSKFWRFPWFPAIFLVCVINRYTVYILQPITLFHPPTFIIFLSFFYFRS